MGLYLLSALDKGTQDTMETKKPCYAWN